MWIEGMEICIYMYIYVYHPLLDFAKVVVNLFIGCLR